MIDGTDNIKPSIGGCRCFLWTMILSAHSRGIAAMVSFFETELGVSWGCQCQTEKFGDILAEWRRLLA